MKRKKLREASKAPRQQRRVNFADFRKGKAKKSKLISRNRKRIRETGSSHNLGAQETRLVVALKSELLNPKKHV
jgi:hypothetical protein